MATIPDIISMEKLEKLQRLARGERDQTPVPMGIRTAESHESPNPQPADGTVTVNGLDLLFSRAMQSENGQTRKLAERIRNLASDLQQRVHLEERAQRQRLEEHVAELEQQLALTRARLNALNRAVAISPRSVHTRPASTKSTVDAAAIRIWAADNNYEVKPVGRVPKEIIAAWRKATLQTETAEDE